MDEDQVVKQLMSMLGNKKELQIRSADGKMIKLCLDTHTDSEETYTAGNLETEFNMNYQPSQHAIDNQLFEEEECKKFEKILEEANNEEEPIACLNEMVPIKVANIGLPPGKKVSLSSKNKNKGQTNEAVINFISDNSNNPKKNPHNMTLTTNATTNSQVYRDIRPSGFNHSINANHAPSQNMNPRKTHYPKNNVTDVSQSIRFLKQNHPEDQIHIEIISQRMLELQKMEQDKMKLDEEISSILSASFSNSIGGGMLFESSIDTSLLSISGLNMNGVSDPLCKIFSNYIKRTEVAKKSQSQKMPSFLFMYSQPMLDTRGAEINDQINYYEEESIIQKILKQCKIDYIREQATIDKFNYWLKHDISVLHYCGHGVQDYLLFESHSGLSAKMDGEKLQKIVMELPNPLQLVFVASCHSQSTGKIFQQAGAVHVICVKDSFQILDEVCHEFARIFYHSCINSKMTICQAYAFAKKQISLSQKFSKHECAKFIILKNHNEKQCKSNLDIVKDGEFRDLTMKPFYRKNIPSRVENFIPRPRDLHEILKLLYNKNRFISIIGFSGIGKSTLARELVRYVQFRNLFKDGVIYLDIRSCEKMRKIFEIFAVELFQNSPSTLNKGFMENTQKFVKELHQREVLIILDNCQNIMLSEDKNDFKKMIEAIMKNCDDVYFVFTNRSSIGRQIDYCSQKFYELGKLTDSQSETLFFQRAPRNIDKKQLEEFFKIEEVKDFSKHPFFEFLNGHPEAICMTASLLSERSLNEIYELLMKPHLSLTNQFHKENNEDEHVGVNPLVETAMKISLNVLKNKHKEASEMIKTLSLLPIGIDHEMMFKLFGQKWKETVKKLIHHSLVHSQDTGGCKYFSVHPYIIIYVQSEINQQQKLKIHEKISDEFLKRIEKVYRHVGTLSPSSQKAQQQFLTEQENYKAIIFREISFYGLKNKIKRLYNNLFQADFSEDQFDNADQNISITTQAVEGIHKKRVYNEKILQPTKKQSICILMVYYVTILFITKNPSCTDYIDYGIFLSRKKKKFIVEANLLRIKGCIFMNKNKLIDAKDYFLKSWDLFAIEGCGLGSAGCEAAVGYIRWVEQEYALAKKNMQNALKYYDQIAHPFGKHYLNRWLCTLKTKMNRAQKQLISHREQAQKLLKETKTLLKSNSFNNSSLTTHKLGKFVFRFTFDNISLFLEASFEVDVKPKIINETALKKTEQRGAKNQMLEEIEQDEILHSLCKNEKIEMPKRPMPKHR